MTLLLLIIINISKITKFCFKTINITSSEKCKFLSEHHNVLTENCIACCAISLCYKLNIGLILIIYCSLHFAYGNCTMV